MQLELHGIYKYSDIVWFEVIDQYNTEEGTIYTCKTVYSTVASKIPETFTLLEKQINNQFAKSSVSEVTLKLIKEYGKPDKIERYLKCQKTKSN